MNNFQIAANILLINIRIFIRGLTNFVSVYSIQLKFILNYWYNKWLILFLIFPGALNSQDTESNNGISFRFTDGIYENFQQVLTDSPVRKSDLLIAEDYDDYEFFKRILSTQQLRYTLPDGGTAVIDNKNVWGFASGGIMYVKWKGYFSELYMLGTVSCFFLHDDNYMTYQKILRSNYLPSENVPAKQIHAVSFRDLKKYLIDFRTGKIKKLNVQNLSKLLKNDRELYAEYNQLPLKRRKALIFYYIGIYNKKNPLYLPLK